MATQAAAEAKEQNQPPPPTTAKINKGGSISSGTSVFYFWIYLILAVSLLAFLLAFFLPHLRRNNSNDFLSLPDDLRLHFSRGRLLKLHSHSPTQVFAIDSGPRDAAHTLLLLPGLAASSFSFRHVISHLSARGLRAVSLDFPGSGFSESPPTQSKNPLWNAVQEIRNKGLFSAFDQLIETGQLPNHHHHHHQNLNDPFSFTAAASRSSSPYGPEEMASIIRQVVDVLGLEPLHLVLHDSALGAGASYVLSNPSAVRSVTLVDSVAGLPAFPSLLLGVPVVGHLILGIPVVFKGLLRLCCDREINGDAAEAHRVQLKRKAVFEAGKGLNYSFDLAEWKKAQEEEMKVLMLWSSSWSDRWIEEGRRAASAIPEAKFLYHSGGRWPQEDAAEEISDRMVEFVFSLPKLEKRTEDSKSEHIEESVDETAHYEQQHQYQPNYYPHGQGQDESDGHAASYMDMYGLGQG